MVDQVSNQRSVSGLIDKYINSDYELVRAIALAIDDVSALNAEPAKSNISALAEIINNINSVADNIQALEEYLGTTPYEIWLIENPDGTNQEYLEFIRGAFLSFNPPSLYGADTTGISDSTVALQAWADAVKDSGHIADFDPNATYRTTGTVYLGNAEGTAFLQGIRGNGAEIVIDFDHGVGLNLIGVQNGALFSPKDFTVRTASGRVALHGMTLARPKQESAIRSSGNALWSRISVYGDYLGTSVYNCSSESNVYHKCYFENNIGLPYALCKTDYFRDTFRIGYDNETTPLTAGKVITGGTSGATATIIRVGSDELFCKTHTDTLDVETVFGNGLTFVDNEIITDTEGGMASINAPVTAKMPNGYIVHGKMSEVIDIEEQTTATFQVFDATTYFNNRSSQTLFPALLIQNFSEVVINTVNMNNIFAAGNLIEALGDGFVRPDGVAGAGCAGLKINAAYLHAAHDNSVQIGCAITDEAITQSFLGLEITAPLTAGANNNRLKCVGSNVLITSPKLDIEGNVDLGDARLIGSSKVRMISKNGSTLTANGRLEGELYCDSSTVLNLTMNDINNLLKVIYSDTSLSDYSRQKIQTLDNGHIVAEGKIISVWSEVLNEDDTLTHLDLLNDSPINGETVTLFGGNVNETITIIPASGGGNFRTPNYGRIILDKDHGSTFVYRENNNTWSLVGEVSTGVTDCLGFEANTGTADKTTVVTYDATNAVDTTFNQSELQNIANIAQVNSEQIKAIKDAMISSGLIRE